MIIVCSSCDCFKQENLYSALQLCNIGKVRDLIYHHDNINAREIDKQFRWFYFFQLFINYSQLVLSPSSTGLRFVLFHSL